MPNCPPFSPYLPNCFTLPCYPPRPPAPDCTVSKLAKFVHYGGGSGNECCEEEPACCTQEQPTCRRNLCESRKSKCAPVKRKAPTRKCPPLPCNCTNDIPNCKDLPAQRLRNVDILEELCYFVPGGGKADEMDCYTVDCCGNVEKVVEDECSCGECGCGCCDDDMQPVKYSRRQRFTFNEAKSEGRAHCDPWPFEPPCDDHCGRGGGNKSNSQKKPGCGGCGEKPDPSGGNACCGRGGRKYTYCPEEPIDCAHMLPPESGVYYYDKDRRAFVPEKELPKCPEIIEKEIDIPEVEEYELLSEEKTECEPPSIQPVIQPIILPTGGSSNCPPPCGPCYPPPPPCQPYPPPCNPCNPPPCNPCNPCDSPCNPCNPCNSPCNPCNSPCNLCNSPCNPCNPCGNNKSCNAPCNPCNRPCNPCNAPCNPCNRQCNPCNAPCNPCNRPCNPCNAPCNPCNPCNAPCNPCNPCNPSYNPCNPCPPPCNPCMPCGPMNPFMNMGGGVLPMVIPMCPQQPMGGMGMQPPPPPFPFPFPGKKNKKSKSSKTTKTSYPSYPSTYTDNIIVPGAPAGLVDGESAGSGYGVTMNPDMDFGGEPEPTYNPYASEPKRVSMNAGTGVGRTIKKMPDGTFVTTVDFPPGAAEDVAVSAIDSRTPLGKNINVITELDGGDGPPGLHGKKLKANTHYKEDGATITSYRVPQGQDGIVRLKRLKL